MPKVRRKSSGTGMLSALLAVLALAGAVSGESCSGSLNSDQCLALSEQHIDLSPLAGTWQTVYFRESLGSTQASIPSFFNLSLCGELADSPCGSGNSVCYSEHLDTFYSLGQSSTCQYSYHDRQLELTFGYDHHAHDVFGVGNVTVTLVCGRSLGVPEVVIGDPSTGSVDILWITSAACKTDTELVAGDESRCYFIQSYEEDGVKARFIDLSHLIRPEGYEASHEERSDALFKISICRPLSLGPHPCNGSMVCLLNTDSHFGDSFDSPPYALAGRGDAEEAGLHMEGDLLTVIYSQVAEGCEGGRRKVKVHFLCPTGDEAFGPNIVFLDDQLCFIDVNWHTTYACGTSAYESTGCKLTTGDGVTFDLSGLGGRLQTLTPSTGGKAYRYELQICNGTSITTECGLTPPPDIRVAQFDNEVCHSLGSGTGKLRYADGSLSLTYFLGATCHSNFARTSVINFVCPETLTNVSSSLERVSFLSEKNCFYEFEWVTPLACGSETSGASDCEFELAGSTYDFASLVGVEDKNWVAVDAREDTACFMVNPCGKLSITEDSMSPTEYCNSRVAPAGCLSSSVCEIRTDGGINKIGSFDLQDSSLLTTVDKHVLTVTGEAGSTGRTAIIHYVCKTGDMASPPVFVGVTNDVFYEFHWTTFAACPQGIQVGGDCMVTHEATGFKFNLTSLSSSMYTYEEEEYSYDISVCSPLDETSACHSHDSEAGLCQAKKVGGGSKIMGRANSTLVYADGTLKLHYNGGEQCKKAPHRNSTILFDCDSHAHKPVVSSVTEIDYCQYVVEVGTKLACPPAYRATECVHFDGDGNSYDFSELSRQVGNWQAQGSDGSVYYINVCQPVNLVGGCSPLSAVCRVKTTPHGTEHTDLGLASSASFKVVHTENKHSVALTYASHSTASSSQCDSVETRIEFVCNGSVFTESGPRFASGGDEANPCQYNFIWETPGACAVKPVQVTNGTCALTDPKTGYIYDFSPLGQRYHTVTAEDVSYSVLACGHLNFTCHHSSSAAVCQHIQKDTREYSCGDATKQTLRFFEGSITMWYQGGDACSHVTRNRSILLNMECDRSVYIGEPRYVQERDCEYSFEWPTALACPPRELECLAEGGDYDLQPLLGNRNWVVTTSGSNSFTYVIGGCRSLSIDEYPKCPRKPGLGACKFPFGDGAKGSGVALGYVTGDLVTVREGLLRLTYYNGDKCENGRSGVVFVEFKCDPDVGAGVPSLVRDDQTSCETSIEWFTQYACARDASSSSPWVITNPVTHQVYNLTTLSPVLSRIHAGDDGVRYNYSLGLGGHSVKCPGHDAGDVGACQSKLSSGSSYAIGAVNSTLSFIGGELRVEYTHGDWCHHSVVQRKTVVSFECDSRELLEVLPERACEYSFVVHTPLVCEEGQKIGIECQLEGFADLTEFLSLSAPAIRVNDSAKAFVSVCAPISADNQEDSSSQGCSDRAAACVRFNDGKVVDLGHPDQDYPPSLMDGGGGVLLNYTHGDCCDAGCEHRFQTDLLLVCDRNEPIGVPTLLSSGNCKYLFQWQSIHACPLEIPTTKYSKSACSITDPSSGQTYDFTSLASQSVEVAGTTYHLRLCGTATKSPPGCSADDTGICRVVAGHAETVVQANHTISITSHSPHVFEVLYPSGAPCGHGQTWSALVTLQCSTRGGTPSPVFVSAEDCILQFLWKNSSFCLGEEDCVATDTNSGFVYDLDGLFSQTWAGKLSGDDTFTVAVCRNLNPLTPSGQHCSAPAGICLSTSGKHLNLGHMTSPPRVDAINSKPVVVLEYSDGDPCGSAHYHTSVTLMCSMEESPPSLQAINGDDCGYSMMWHTPRACRPNITEADSCRYSADGQQYNFRSLAHRMTFTQGDESYTVCLCNGSACKPPGIWHDSHLWGTFHRMVIPNLATSPKMLFVNGDVCQGSTRYQSTVFMECDRSADKEKGKFALQESLSQGCQKFFFWYTPYACLSEEVSCTLTSGSEFYDFTPLHSESGPWRTKGDNGDEYLVNICGPVSGTGCSPQASVCHKKSDGTFEDLATTDTQRMAFQSTDHVQIRYNGPRHCGSEPSHVTINMVCGVGGLTFSSHRPDDCHYTFQWHTPFACQSSQFTQETECKDTKVSKAVFHPQLLSMPSDSQGYTVTDDSGRTYHINFCAGLDQACNGASVCRDGLSNLGSYHYQTITYYGYRMEIEMTASRSGDVHTIISVQCAGGDSDPDGTAVEQVEFENHVRTRDGHHYYYFRMLTKKGCSVSQGGSKSPDNGGGGGQDNGDKGGQGGGDKKRSSSNGAQIAGAIVAVLIITVLVAILAALLLYKRERREVIVQIAMKAFGPKSSEPIRYRKVTTHEETALLEDGSESEGHHSDGEEGEGTPADDDELINL